MAEALSGYVELEKTYLARSIPQEIALRAISSSRLVDVYISSGADDPSPELRARSKNGAFEITKKIAPDPSDMSTQTELTIPISQSEFGAIEESFPSSQVVKDRFNLEIDGRKAEFDVFQDALKGLVLVEFEFADREDYMQFEPPKEYCLVDVTQESFIAGGRLAGKSYSDIQPRLEQFGYTPIGVSESQGEG